MNYLNYTYQYNQDLSQTTYLFLLLTRFYKLNIVL